MIEMEQKFVTIPGKAQTISTVRSQRGMTLLEVMIAVLILAIGLLGIAALQATALRNSQSSMERSQAVIGTYSILDAMRANVVGTRLGNYAMARTCAASTTAGTPADVLRDADQQAWINELQKMGQGSCGTIACTGTGGLPTAPAECTVTVEWNDSRGLGGITAQPITTVAQI